MSENIFVLGLDARNRRILEHVPDTEFCRFHAVLSFQDIYGEQISFGGLLDAAVRQLDGFEGSIDAIIGFWDFPVSSLLPLLRKRYGLPSVSLAEVVMCEHKYWSRLVQQTVIDEYPAFGLVDPRNDQDPPEALRYPMWVKPVKSFSSVLAFGVGDREAFWEALQKIREGIRWIGEPFEELLGYVDLPAEIAAAGGQVCLAEETLVGRQVTVEGYRYRGEVVVYGVVESVPFEGSPSFLRFQYPTSLPDPVTERLAGITRRVVEAIGLEGMTFNIEYFWDPDTDAIRLLEINPRHSQSHAELFEYVDGMTNHQVMVRLALDSAPEFPHGQGRYTIAAKWFVRRFSDGIIHRGPSQEEIDAVERSIPGTGVDVVVQAGDRLSDLPRQDSYSYQLASVYVGADDETELKHKFDRVLAALPFEIDDIADQPDEPSSNVDPSRGDH